MPLNLGIGSVDKHLVEVVHSKSLRLFRIIVDGRNVYWHCRLLPWAGRLGMEIKTAEPEVHARKVELPHGRQLPPDASNYLLRLDGQAVTRGGIN